jgi:ATP phosphoribosyltransferase
LLAAQGFCDAFFCGDDWAREWELRGYPSRKFMGLGIGKVQIVAAAKPEKNERRIAASEYPYIARDYMAKLGADAQIIKYGEPVKGGFAVIDSMGKTELKLIYGMADFVVENTQTGSTLKALGLVVKELLFDSECSFYTAKGLADEWKLKKAERIAMMLKGAISAYGTDLVTFNVANSQLEKVLAYVRQNKLFGDEETLVRGERMSELTLQLQTANPAKPLIDIIADLREFGATSIDGVPLSYSVR